MFVFKHIDVHEGHAQAVEEGQRTQTSHLPSVVDVGQRPDKPIEFRSEARVWSLYLEDAEEEAKERAEIWRTGLDSLLIFVSSRNAIEIDEHDFLIDDAGWFVRWDRIVFYDSL